MASRLEALRRAEGHKVFSEQISTRGKVRPEPEKALALAHRVKGAAPETPVISTVHELKRLARNATELMMLSAELQTGGIKLEFLTGPVTGIYDPGGMRAMFFAVPAVAGQIERDHIREKALEGQAIAASKGNHGGRPKIIDDDMLTFAAALKDKGVPVPEIAKKPTVKVGKNAGESPSVASLYRALAEVGTATVNDGLPLRPELVRIRRPEDPLTPEEIDLRERLQAQPPPERGDPQLAAMVKGLAPTAVLMVPKAAPAAVAPAYAPPLSVTIRAATRWSPARATRRPVPAKAWTARAEPPARGRAGPRRARRQEHLPGPRVLRTGSRTRGLPLCLSAVRSPEKGRPAGQERPTRRGITAPRDGRMCARYLTSAQLAD